MKEQGRSERCPATILSPAFLIFCTTFPSTAQVVEALQPNTAVVVYDWRNNTLQV